MPNYRRAFVPGGCWFFTVNLLERRQTLLVDHIDALRNAVVKTRKSYPFKIDAVVVLPDHLHAGWTLPPGDADFSIRWRLIKSHFVKVLPKQERRSAVRKARGERGIWQRRFWEHLIRDESDYARHIEYCYINPSNIGLRRAYGIGHIRRFTAMSSAGFSRLIGRAIWTTRARSASGHDRLYMVGLVAVRRSFGEGILAEMEWRNTLRYCAIRAGLNTHMTTTIYIRLLDEGTEVFRPTTADDLGGGVFKVLPSPDYNPQDETWEFVPGTLVRCAKRKMEGDEVLVAMKT